MSWTLEDPNNLNSTISTFYWIQKVDSKLIFGTTKIWGHGGCTINQIKVQKSDVINLLMPCFKIFKLDFNFVGLL